MRREPITGELDHEIEEALERLREKASR